MTSQNTLPPDTVYSSPTLRKNSQADQIIFGQDAQTSGEPSPTRRFFQRSTWHRNLDIRPNTMSRPQNYPSAPNSVVSPSGTPAPGKPLTDMLLEHQPFLLELATKAPFLVAAGTGNLSKAMLSKWLSQDRLYAQGHISLIGALLSRVDLPYAYIEDKNCSLRWRIVNMLSSCLENIQRELRFFEDVARRYDLNLEFSGVPDGSRPFTADAATKHYIELFRAFWTDPTMTLLDGLVVLWATEFCYLAAWRYAGSLLNPGRRDDLDGGALRNEFIPNWTSVEFEKFVAEIKECTDLLAEREDASGKMEVFKAIWVHILGIEKKFWPEM